MQDILNCVPDTLHVFPDSFIFLIHICISLEFQHDSCKITSGFTIHNTFRDVTSAVRIIDCDR